MAQLAVAVALEAICWRFESSYTHQFIAAESNITENLVRIKADQPISTSDAGNGYTEPA